MRKYYKHKQMKYSSPNSGSTLQRCVYECTQKGKFIRAVAWVASPGDAVAVVEAMNAHAETVRGRL